MPRSWSPSRPGRERRHAAYRLLQSDHPVLTHIPCYHPRKRPEGAWMRARDTRGVCWRGVRIDHHPGCPERGPLLFLVHAEWVYAHAPGSHQIEERVPGICPQHLCSLGDGPVDDTDRLGPRPTRSERCSSPYPRAETSSPTPNQSRLPSGAPHAPPDRRAWPGRPGRLPHNAVDAGMTPARCRSSHRDRCPQSHPPRTRARNR